MIEFLNSSLGQIIARNGILALILAWSLFVNHTLTERLFTVIQNNTEALSQVRDALKKDGISATSSQYLKGLASKNE